MRLPRNTISFVMKGTSCLPAFGRRLTCDKAEEPFGAAQATAYRQLLVPLAIAGHGSFKTLCPSQHTITNIDVLKRFLDIEITSQQCGKQSWHVEIKGASGGETNPTAPLV